MMLPIGTNITAVCAFARYRVRAFNCWRANAPTRQRANPSTSGARGLTLIEILISIAILAGGSVLVMQALARGAYVLSVATNRMRVYEFSRTKMADLDITLKRGQEPKPRGRFRMGRESFDWSVLMLPTSDPELQQVTLTVTWEQGRHAYASEFSTVTRVEDEEGVL